MHDTNIHGQVNTASMIGTLRDWQSEASPDQLLEGDEVGYDFHACKEGEHLRLVVGRFGEQVASIKLEIDKGAPRLVLGHPGEAFLSARFVNNGLLVENLKQFSMERVTESRYCTEPNHGYFLPSGVSLDEARRDAFDSLVAGYDFGYQITDSSGVEANGSVMTQKLYGEDGDNKTRLIFRVRFAEESATPIDVCALDLNSGNTVGHFTE